MTGDHAVGTAYMPDDALEFVLEPGDVLYLPVFWSHWGVSDGPSLSISVALNSASALQSVLPLIGEELAAHRAWWQPLPPGEPDLDALWQALDDPALRHRIGTALRARHRAGVRHGLHAPVPGRTPNRTTVQTVQGNPSPSPSAAHCATCSAAPRTCPTCAPC